MKILRNSLAAIIALFAVGATIASQAKVSAVTPTEGCFNASALTTPLNPGWTAPANPSNQASLEIVPNVTLTDIQSPLEVSPENGECPRAQETVCCYEIQETSTGVFKIVRVYYKED